MIPNREKRQKKNTLPREILKKQFREYKSEEMRKASPDVEPRDVNDFS